MPLAEYPEWRYTVVVIATCIVINLTLPLWLRLAKFLDDHRVPVNIPEVLDDASESDHSQRNGKENSNRHNNSGHNRALSEAPSSTALGALLEARPKKTGRVDHHKRRKPSDRDIRFSNDGSKHSFRIVENSSDGSMEVVALPSINDSNTHEGSLGGTKSYLSPLSVGDVSIREGVKERVEPTTTNVHVSPYERRSCCQVALEVSEWDSSLASLAGFYMVAGLTEKITAIVELAVIGHAIGTAEANAYIMVTFLFEITGILVAGFQEAIGVLVPQADGSGNDLMVGRYLQIGIIFTILFDIPGFLIWSYYMYDTVLWFGFDEETATIAQNYTYSVLVAYLVEDIDECFREFLDVIDREKYNTIYSVVSDSVVTGLVAALAYSGVSNMVVIGMAQSNANLFFLLVNILIIVRKGWLDDYTDGLVSSFGLKDARAMKTTFVTALPLGLAWLLSMGEWQVMLIFAQSIGPNEVAAWNMLGLIWDLFEALTEALSEAAEVRVGFRMGAGKPQEARKMSEKGIYLGTLVAFITAGGLFVLAEYFLPLMTPNLLYQKLIFDQLPLIGFGGILMVPGLVIEGILCAQGRVRLMTSIEIIVSWFIAIPLAAIFVYYFKSGLEGVVSGLVVGYSAGATVLLFFFLRSNWELLSEKVIKQNAAEGLQHLDTEWDELPEKVQNAALTLGYTKIMWESNREPACNEKSWDDLTAAERAAAAVLGYNKKKWNGETNSTDDNNNYEAYDFDDLPPDVRKSAKILGFTRSSWDRDAKIPIESKEWVELTEAQQKAAITLGYTQEKWDDSDSDSSSSSPSQDAEANSIISQENEVATSVIPQEKESIVPTIPQEKEESMSSIGSKEKEESTSSIGSKEKEESTSSISLEEKEEDYNDYDFKELPEEVRNAAKFLGYTKKIWDKDGKIPIESKEWEELTPEQQNAARTLGYTQQKWDDESDSSSSSSSEEEENPEAVPPPATPQIPTVLVDDTTAAPTITDLATSSGKLAVLACDGGPQFAQMGASLCSSMDGSSSLASDELSDSVLTESDILSRVQQQQQSSTMDGRTTTTTMVGMDPEHVQSRESSRFTVTNYGHYQFDDLPSDLQKAARVLGFTKSTWDKNLFIPRKTKTWDSLTPEETRAALTLGCTEEKWEKLLDSW